MAKQRGAKTDEYKSVFGNRPSNNNGAEMSCDWSSASPGKILDLISIVSSRGGAIRFGYTRDGGAYAIGLYYGADHKTVYSRPSEDLETFIETWTEFFRDLPYSAGVSPDNSK